MLKMMKQACKWQMADMPPGWSNRLVDVELSCINNQKTINLSKWRDFFDW
jgi:hypothetical protein